jgi:hypothetical protein
MNRHLNNEEQEWKTDHTKEKGTHGKGRVKERSKESEYGWCTFYTRINTEFLNMLKSL